MTAFLQTYRRFGAAALVASAALATGCGGGGGGGPGNTNSGNNPPPAGTPAAGVYLGSVASSSQLRPSFAAVVSHASSGLPPWTAWDATSADDRVYQGTTDIASATSSTAYFDSNGRQSGTSDLRTSTSTQLRGSSLSGALALSLDTTQLGTARLLSPNDLSRTWEGNWRHGASVATSERITFTAGTNGARVFQPSSLTILNCLVSASVTEQRAGSPGLFNVTLTLSQVTQSGSACSRAGSYSGVLAAYVDANGARQLRLVALDANQQLAISFVAAGV